MIELAVLAICMLFLAIVLVQHYASPGTPLLIKTLAIISFWLGFGGVVLLPIDLSRTRFPSLQDDLDDSTNDNTVVEGSVVNDTFGPWKVTYWSTFMLAWLVLPFVREVLYSGYFSITARIKMGFRKYMINHMIMGALSIVFVIALAIHLKSWHVIPILMAMGNTYGLLLVSLLLGYGLVDFPRQLWRKALPESELRRSQIMATAADEALCEAVWELQDCEDAIDAAVLASKTDSNNSTSSDTIFEESPPHKVEKMPCADCLQELIRLRNLTAVLDDECENRRTRTNRPSSRPTSPDNIDSGIGPVTNRIPAIDDLAQLSARLKLAQASLVSCEQRWVEIIDTHNMYSQLVNGELEYPTKDSSSSSNAANTWKYIRWWTYYIWMTKLRGCTFRLIGICAASLSGIVLWSEATMWLSINLSPFAFGIRMFDADHLENGIFFMIAALIPLVYMSICVYSSLFKVSIFGPNALRGWKQSPGVALVFNAQYLIRMQFPLGYNYLLMLKIDTSSTNCAFSKVMSDMSTVPFLGTSFSFYAPLLIIGLCFFTLYNGYPRILAILGIDHEDSTLIGDQETLDNQVNDGIALLSRNQRRQQNKSEQGNSNGANGNNANGGENTNWWYNVVV